MMFLSFNFLFTLLNKECKLIYISKNVDIGFGINMNEHPSI